MFIKRSSCMKKVIVYFTCILIYNTLAAQDEKNDTLLTLDAVTVRAFGQFRSQHQAAVNIKFIDNSNSDRYNKTSLVNSFNTLAGVRMEERSPGSYRINIRGSSLRSPFGVRNVKVYWNDLPFTDPGGNTYFNQLAYNNFSGIEIFKGPAGSMYGAGTGGLILINTLDNWKAGASYEYLAGSYSLENIFGSVRFGKNGNRTQLTYAKNESDGYRDQSALRRDNFSWISQIKISDKQQLTASLLYCDMYYQTPGALTFTEYINNPRSARPAAGGFPSAVDARAAIFQKNLLTGFTNDYSFNSTISNTTTLYGSFAQVKNSAIRNYERRIEPAFGGRTIFSFENKKNSPMGWKFIAGSEMQFGFFNTQVSKNKDGSPDSLQTNDDIDFSLYSFFVQADGNINNKWFITTGLSINKTNIDFIRLSNFPTTKQSRSYKNELAPSLAIKRKVTEDFSISALVSRGFSPPTIAELLPSTGNISTDLEAEHGWNYELSGRIHLFNNKIQLEATGFYFKLIDALVQRRDLSGADFFVNAGDVDQKGLEFHADYIQVFTPGSFVNYISFKNAYAYSHFRYGSFVKGVDDFSGNIVPSVPAHAFSSLADIQVKNGLYSNASFYTASKIWLNDANTAIATGYYLLGWRVGWKKTFKNIFRLNIYAGADNLLDEQYSLGNDINASSGRYYNAAPERNYYAGIVFQWINASKN